MAGQYFSPNSIQEGYVVTRAVSRLPDGSMSVLPNVRQMIHQRKSTINWKQRDYDNVIQKIPMCAAYMMEKGFIDDEFLLNKANLDRDKDANGNEFTSNTTMNQIWLHRSVIYSHSAWRQHAFSSFFGIKTFTISPISALTESPYNVFIFH